MQQGQFLDHCLLQELKQFLVIAAILPAASYENRPLAFLSAPIAAASQVLWTAREAYGLFQTKRDEAA